jgi:hypothetical protein
VSDSFAEDLAGLYFDSEIASAYGRVPDDISPENLERQRAGYVAAATRSPEAMAEIMKWVTQK